MSKQSNSVDYQSINKLGRFNQWSFNFDKGLDFPPIKYRAVLAGQARFAFMVCDRANAAAG